MKKITNNHGIDLPLAVWLLQNGYYSGADKAPEGELISVTSLMKPTRQAILSRMVDEAEEEMDLADLVASRMGHGLHDSIEGSWKNEHHVRQALKRLHYQDKVIDRIKVNPDPKELDKDDIPIYLERRGYLEIAGIVLTGQLDFAINGAYRDFKSTSTYSYTSGSKDEDYILQGSMYRLIMPEYIWRDTMRIEFIFTDWAKYRAKADPTYPQARVAHKEFKLMSEIATQEWIHNKIDDIKTNVRKLKNKGQDGMVRCTDKELWRGADTWKYYSNPETAKKKGKCQKSFENEADAMIYLKEKGKGEVVKFPGEVKACTYCPAFSVCEQRKEYFKDV